MPKELYGRLWNKLSLKPLLGTQRAGGGNSQNGFIKGRMTSLVDKGTAVHVVYWGFSKTFGTVSLILVDLKL